MKCGPFLAPVEKLTWNDDLGFWCLSLSLCFWGLSSCWLVGWLVWVCVAACMCVCVCWACKSVLLAFFFGGCRCAGRLPKRIKL